MDRELCMKDENIHQYSEPASAIALTRSLRSLISGSLPVAAIYTTGIVVVPVLLIKHSYMMTTVNLD